MSTAARSPILPYDTSLLLCLPYLSLPVRSGPLADALLADLRQARADLRGELVGQGHEAFRLIRGVSEHDSLVTRSDVFDSRGIHGLCDVGGLLLHGHHDVARLVVEALSGVVVPNILEGVADHLLIVHVGVGRDLPKDHHHARLGARLACHAGALIVLEARVENGIRNLIADLVRVALIFMVCEVQFELVICCSSKSL